MNSQSRVGHRFIVLVSSQVLSQLGNNFFSLALLWYVLKITGSRSDVAIMAALQVFPNVFSLFAGTFADRMNRWNLMIITDISRFAIAGLIAGLGFGHLLSIWILGGLVFLLQLTGTFFTPAEMAVFPSMVSQEALATANGINQALTMVSQLVGMALGGLLLVIVGPFTLMLLNSVSFIISVVALLFIKPRNTEMPDGSALHQKTTFSDDWKDGIKEVLKQKTLRMLIPIAVIVNFALAPIMSLDAPWIKQVLHLQATQYGLVGASMMLGIMVGNIFVGYLNTRVSFRRLLPIGLAVMAGCVICLSQIPVYLVTITCMIGFGIAAGVINASLFTLIQKITPGPLLGRVSGVMFSFTTISLPIGMAVGSALAVHVSLAFIFAGGGVLAAIGAVLSLLIPDSVNVKPRTS